jgi:hypothetical protein
MQQPQKGSNDLAKTLETLALAAQAEEESRLTHWDWEWLRPTGRKSNVKQKSNANANEGSRSVNWIRKQWLPQPTLPKRRLCCT